MLKALNEIGVARLLRNAFHQFKLFFNLMNDFVYEIVYQMNKLKLTKRIAVANCEIIFPLQILNENMFHTLMVIFNFISFLC